MYSANCCMKNTRRPHPSHSKRWWDHSKSPLTSAASCQHPEASTDALHRLCGHHQILDASSPPSICEIAPKFRQIWPLTNPNFFAPILSKLGPVPPNSNGKWTQALILPKLQKKQVNCCICINQIVPHLTSTQSHLIH
jgi:hypothetical protein